MLNQGRANEHQIDDEATLDEIIEQHTSIDIDEEAILEDVEPPPRVLPSPQQAIEAVRLLQTFQEHQSTAQHQDLRFLQNLERHLCTIYTSNLRQGSLEQWIT